MDFPDFTIFYTAAKCFLGGQSPYSCAGFFYPLPTVLIFLPFALFPLQIAKWLWFFAGLASFVYVFKRRAVWYILFVPVLQAFILGQLDTLLLPAIVAGSGLGMAFLTLKPQLVCLWLPFWFLGASPRNRAVFLAASAVLWVIPTLIDPGWPVEFLQTTRPLSQAAYASPSVWAGGSFWLFPALAGLLIFAKSRDKYAGTLAANPAINHYDLILVLPNARWWIVPVSWITWIICLRLGNAWAGLALSLLVAFWPQEIRKPGFLMGVKSWMANRIGLNQV